MKKQSKFPAELLKRPWEERLSYFKACKVPHQRMQAVTQEIRSTIKRRDGEGFIFVVGPTRIGKTTVYEHLMDELLKEAADEMRRDLGCIPVAGMEARSYPRGYDWKDHWVGCLTALNEPLIEYKRAPKALMLEAEETNRAAFRESRTAAVLRRSFEKAAGQRKLRVFCIDEAHHLTLVPQERLHRDQIEIIKSVASHSGAMHVLFGTYDLLRLRNANGQLGSRAVTIHYNRYQPNIESDLKDFADAVLSLVPHMPLPEAPDLRDDLDYCFEISLGLLGLMKVWLTDALGGAMERGQRTLTRKDLEKFQPDLDVLEKITREIVEGEAKLKQHDKLRSLIRWRMQQGGSCFGQRPPDFQVSGAASSTAETSGKTPAAGAPKKRSGRIERKPKRDPAGGGRKKSVA